MSDQYVSAEFLAGIGILREVNRRFFHPLGMAMQIDQDGVVLIQDHTYDTAGVVFDEECMSPALFFERYDPFEEFAASRHEAREREVGFVVQPVPPRPE